MATALLFMSTAGALSQELGDSELFGREDEPSTSEVGKVEQAKDGTLFLDEIGEMTLEMQGQGLAPIRRAHV